VPWSATGVSVDPPVSIPDYNSAAYARARIPAYHDVSCFGVYDLPALMDSGTSYAPVCSIINNSHTPESGYPVHMRVGTAPTWFYDASVAAPSLAPGEKARVQFASSVVWPRGSWTAKCSTERANDTNRLNDKASVLVQAQVRDVGCSKIEFPFGAVDSGTSITPACSVFNYGSTTEGGYQVRMLVGNGPSYVYVGTAAAPSQAPGQRRYVTFPSVAANWPRNIYPVNCSTELAGDANSSDNRAGSRSVTVQVHDVGVTRILAPQGAIDSGLSVTPACSVADFGTCVEAGYTVRMKVGTAPTYVYNQTAIVPNHNPGEVLYVTFPSSVVWPRGTYPVTCSTELASDASRGNDRLSGASILVGVHDVAGIRVVAPSGTIDSGTTCTPACSLANFGTHTEAGYQVHLRVGNAPVYVYDGAASAPSLSPGGRDYLTFPATRVWPRGAWPVTCSTELAGDANPANNRSPAGSVTARVHDVTCFRVEVPPGMIDSGTTYTPACSVCNRGSVTEAGYPVHLTVGRPPDYLADQRLAAPSLAPGQSARIAFTPRSDWPRGNWPVNCSTELAQDANPFNDHAPVDTLMVKLHDVGCTKIVYPTGVIDSGQVIAPACSLFNYGTYTEAAYRVRLRVGAAPSPVYDTFALAPSLAPGQRGYLVFPGAANWPRGNYPVACSTLLANDGNRSNDRQNGTTYIQVRDVCALAVVAPVGTIYQNVLFQTVGSVWNSGTRSESLTTHFDIRRQGVPVRSGQVGTVLSASQQASVPVFSGTIADPGTYETRCWVELGPDMHHGNDTARGQLTVRSDVPAGWTLTAELPLGSRLKRVKAGGALAFGRQPGNDTGFVFAFKGNNTCEFYRYNTVSNAWLASDSIPLFNRYTRKKGVKAGGTLARSPDGALFATKGNSTYDFWQLDPNRPLAQRWLERADVPSGDKPVKDGACAVAVRIHYPDASDTNWVYLLKGSGTYEFYRYNALTDGWQTMTPAPTGSPVRTFKKGSCLAYDGADTIFGLKGGTQQLFAYSISGRNWVTRDTLPRGPAKKKTGGGTGIAYADRLLYCLKGNNSDEFWTYECGARVWYQAASIGASTKRVNAGGALVYAESKDACYAFRGNNTLEFWTYGTSADRYPLSADRRPKDVQGTANCGLRTAELRIFPNPFSSSFSPAISYSLPVAGNVSLKLYDISGKLVGTLLSGYRPAGSYSYSLLTAHCSLGSGVYLLKFETEGYATTSKLIIE
jgi:hypothetical protein